MLASQVKRMTADPKARRLATEFFGQWLGFYHFDQYRGVDTTRFPEFTDDVRSAMYDEAISTFEYIVRQNRPVKEVLHADYAFLNKPLAKFYGIERDVASADKVELVPGANAFNRGGALRLVNRTVPLALERLGYAAEEVADIVAWLDAHGTIEGAPRLREEHLAIFDCALRAAGGARCVAPSGHLRMMASEVLPTMK